MRFRILSVLVPAILVVACSLLPLPRSVPTATPAAPAPQPAGLTAAQLRGLDVFLPQSQRTVPLSDGAYEAGSGPEYVLARLLDPVALGDLNGDGAGDAAVLLAENSGGSGVFVSMVAFLNEGGTPVQAGAYLVDDRPVILSLAIQDGRILLDALIHGATDSMVDPTLQVTEELQLGDQALLLTGLSSASQGGAVRSIQIDTPADGAQTAGSIRLVGSLPIAPFENNLSYQVYDRQGNLLEQGPFPVSAAEMGGPASFDQTLDLGQLQPQRVSLQLWDVSMADGSPLAIRSIWVDLRP